MKISEKDLTYLKEARQLLESGSYAIRLSNYFGNGMNGIGRRLPDKLRQKIVSVTVLAIEKSWKYSLKTMSAPDELPASNRQHKIYATLSGAIGGVAIPTLFLEIPFTTIIIMRAVADIARRYGENYHNPETKIACLQIFALGGEAVNPETGETGYYAIRDALKKPLEQSSRYIAEKGAVGMGGPFVAQLLLKIAAYYQPVVTAHIIAKTVPVAGAFVGAAINLLFIEYFQEKAAGHFIIRRLEEKYGPEAVKQAYQALPAISSQPGIKPVTSQSPALSLSYYRQMVGHNIK